MKKTLKILFTIAIILVIALTGIAIYFSNNVVPLIKTNLNENLAVQVEVKDISFSGFKNLPNLGVKLNNVTVAESTPHYNKPMLKAKELYLFIDLWKIYKQDYTITKVIVNEGSINIADFNNGNNYSVTKASESNERSSGFAIENLSINKCLVNYAYVPSKFRTKTFVPSSNFKIKYQNNKINLNSKAQFNQLLLSVEQDNYVNNDVVYNGSLVIDQTLQTVSILPTTLKVKDLALKTEGKVNYDESEFINLKFRSNSASVNNLLQLLPESSIAATEHLELKGKAALNGRLKGSTKNLKKLGFKSHIEFDNLNIKSKTSGQRAVINSTGDINIPNIIDYASSVAEFNISNASTEDNSLKGKVRLRNFIAPKVLWDGEIDLSTDLIKGFLDDNTNVTGGRIKYYGNLAANYDEASGSVAINSMKLQGKVFLSKIAAELTNPAIKIHLLDANLSADNDRIVVNDLNLKFNESEVKLIGYVKEYFSLFNEENNAMLVGSINANNIRLNDFITVDSSAGSTASVSDLLPIKTELKTEISGFSYNDFVAQKFEGTIVGNKQEIVVDDAYLKALDGETKAKINFKKWGSDYLLDINAKAHTISITKLFKQFNEFEQNEITSQNLSGELTGNIIAKVILDANYNPILPKLYAKTNLVIENGQLKDYEPLKELSDFVSVEDLRNVSFNTLSNEIEIFNETIYIPKMRIENNALNMVLEGSHTFDNYMRYNMELSIAELLATKANWIAKKKEKRIEKNITGGLTAYITIEGTPDDLTIKYDKATLKETAKEEIKEEKKNFIETLKGKNPDQQKEIDNKNYDDVWDE